MSRVRVVIENISPQVDGGRFPVKRVLGDAVVVEADVFADGHDKIRCVLLHRPSGETRWQEAPMTALGNDRWRASFVPRDIGPYLYTVKAWLEPLLEWQRKAAKTPDPELTLLHEPPLTVHVDRKRAGYSTWYEFFPRSAASRPGDHGTLADCEARLPYIAAMGFDVVYLSLIHI